MTDRLKLDLAIKDAQPPISMFNINTLFWVLSYKKIKIHFLEKQSDAFWFKKINFYFVKRQAWQLEPIFEYQCFEKLTFKQILLSKNSSCNVWKNWGYFRQIPEQSLKEINYLSQNAQDSLWRDCLNSIKFSFILINLLVSLRLLPPIGGKVIMLLRWVCEWLSVTIELYCPYQLVWI